MRSGQYKISGSGAKGTAGNDCVVVGQFRPNQAELPPSDSPVPEFPHMNSLVVTMNKMSDSRPLNKSCENLSGPRSAVNRVEQRVRSFLQRGEVRLRQEDHPAASSPVEDGWQYGHVVTLPRRPRLSLALSHSALNHLSTSDTASCLSASSGYSSSSSSSYGSFKSSASSNCSTLPRKKNNSEGQVSPSSSRSCTFVDNPMYDITPGTEPHPYNLTTSLKRCGSPSPRHDPIYDVSPTADPREYSLKAYRRRSASVPRHDPVYDVTPDMDLQHFNINNKSAKRRGSAPVHELHYAGTPYSDSCGYGNYNNISSRRESPSLGNYPIYDTIPGNDSYSPYRRSPTQGHENLYDVARPSRLLTPDSGTHGGLDSLEESALDSLDCSDPQTGISEDDDLMKEDQVAKECREYFEKRLKNSESLKKRWSMCSSDSGADSGDSEMSPPVSSSSSSSSSEGPPPSVVASSASSTSNNTTSGLHSSSSDSQEKCSTKKTPLDHKMEFLRKEIASLMKQDNQLFKQLLNLHESISALKSNPPHPHRPPSPASLDSFVEEEEEEEEEDEEEEENKDVQRQQRADKEAEVEDNLSDVDEGLETDHSLTHSISPTSTLSSKSSRDSTLSSKSCRDSTLSSKSSRDSNFSKDSHYSTVEYHGPTSTNTFLADNNTITSDGIRITSNNNSSSNTSTTIIDNSSSISPPSVTCFASNKITRRYSITTNDDFNVNISINSDDVSSFASESPSLSNSTSCLSKSSCYLSKNDPETGNLNLNKGLGGSLGSFSPSSGGRRLVRTRVSIPPSARNRDRSARPESFRLSNDMASHTRVLLKARSFAGASLRESPTHKRNGEMHFGRASLREGQLSFLRDKGCSGDRTKGKMELLAKRFTNSSVKSVDDIYFDYSHRDEVVYDSLSKEYTNSYSDSYQSTKSVESTNIVYVNNSTTENHFESEYQEINSEDHHSESMTFENYQQVVFIPNEEPSHGTDVNSGLNEEINCESPQDDIGSQYSYKKRQKHTVKQPVRQFSLMVPDEYLSDIDQVYQKSQKLRARSFTGMMTPRTLPALPQSPPREVLHEQVVTKKSCSNLKVTEGADLEKRLRVTTMTRRARVTQDGYSFRFSSDLGLGSSSKVTPRSKREVFV